MLQYLINRLNRNDFQPRFDIIRDLGQVLLVLRGDHHRLHVAAQRRQQPGCCGVAAMHGVSRSVAAYSWLMAHPAGIVPIIGSQQAERIVEGAQAVRVQWNRQDWYAVLVAARGENLP